MFAPYLIHAINTYMVVVSLRQRRQPSWRAPCQKRASLGSAGFSYHLRGVFVGCYKITRVWIAPSNSSHVRERLCTGGTCGLAGGQPFLLGCGVCDSDVKSGKVAGRAIVDGS